MIIKISGYFMCACHHLQFHDLEVCVFILFSRETSHLRGDEIQLQRVLQASDLPRLQLERYTFSNALGLSGKSNHYIGAMNTQIKLPVSSYKIPICIFVKM